MAMIKLIQTKSGIGRSEKQRATLRGLGLKKLHQESVVKDSLAVCGMVKKVAHLISWEEVKG
jgi:large subunit ribosomal protein L30